MYIHLFFHPLQDKLTQIYRYFLHFSLTTQTLVLARSSLDLSDTVVLNVGATAPTWALLIFWGAEIFRGHFWGR